MKKKVVTLLLAGLLLALAACGGNTGMAGGADAQEQEQAEPQPGTPSETEEPAASAESESQGTSAAAPGSGTPSDVEAAGENGPKVDAPEETAEGPAVTETTPDPGAVPGGSPSPDEEGGEEAEVWAIEGAGVLFTVPEKFSRMEGVILERGGGETAEGSGVTFYSLSYLGMKPEEYSAFMESASAGQPSDEEIDKFRKAYRDLFTIYSIDGGRTEEDLRNYLAGEGLTDVKLEQLETVEEYTFFFSDEAASDQLEQLGEFQEEYEELAGLMETYKENISCIEPAAAK